MKAIIRSLFVIGVVAGLTVAATSAFFTDEETSTDNLLAAGAIDLKIDNTSYFNRQYMEDTSWEMKDLENELFFNFQDLKPGDEGEDTIGLQVTDNDAWACVDIAITENSDVSCTDPEVADDSDCTAVNDNQTTLGELAQQLNFIFWVDDGDNVLEDNETILTQGPASDVLDGVTWTLADSQTNVFTGESNDPLKGGSTYHIGKAWCFGTLEPDPVAPGNNDPTDDPGVTCNGESVNNAAQTDSLKGDITFRAVQARNNENFVCATPTPTPTP